MPDPCPCPYTATTIPLYAHTMPAVQSWTVMLCACRRGGPRLVHAIAASRVQRPSIKSLKRGLQPTP